MSTGSRLPFVRIVCELRQQVVHWYVSLALQPICEQHRATSGQHAQDLLTTAVHGYKSCCKSDRAAVRTKDKKYDHCAMQQNTLESSDHAEVVPPPQTGAAVAFSPSSRSTGKVQCSAGPAAATALPPVVGEPADDVGADGSLLVAALPAAPRAVPLLPPPRRRERHDTLREMVAAS